MLTFLCVVAGTYVSARGLESRRKVVDGGFVVDVGVTTRRTSEEVTNFTFVMGKRHTTT